MSEQNRAIDAKTKLKKALESSKIECHSLVTIIDRIIDEALWEYLDIPGESAGDKLYNLIALPYSRGGLNTEIHEIDALLSISSSTQRKFRTIVHQASQGARNDLRPQLKEKVDAELSPAKKSSDKSPAKKLKKPSSSQLTVDRAATRAANAIPEIEQLLEEGLISKNSAAKIGQKVKDPQNPTSQEAKIIDDRQKVKQKLRDILPESLPQDPKERKALSRQVKEIVESTTGKKSSPKVILSSNPEQAAKAISQAVNNPDYLQQLIVAIEFEIEDLQASQRDRAKSSDLSNPASLAA